MIKIDNSKCIGYGVCLRYRGGYCILKSGDALEIDYSVCNGCQKCVAICPVQAFSNDGRAPAKIEKPLGINGDDLTDLLHRRRTIRHFLDKPVLRELLVRVVEAGQYAPTMNKAIEAVVIDDKALLDFIDNQALRFYLNFYRLFFANKPLMKFLGLFSETLPVIKRKLERDIKERARIIKDNTAALILLVGSTKVPLTEISAQYDMANMLLYCETVGLGSCLMDSLKISLNHNKALKDKLRIPRRFKILCVLAVGYPEEKLLNISQGRRMKTGFNMRNVDTVLNDGDT